MNSWAVAADRPPMRQLRTSFVSGSITTPSPHVAGDARRLLRGRQVGALRVDERPYLVDLDASAGQFGKDAVLVRGTASGVAEAPLATVFFETSAILAVARMLMPSTRQRRISACLCRSNAHSRSGRGGVAPSLVDELFEHCFKVELDLEIVASPAECGPNGNA